MPTLTLLEKYQHAFADLTKLDSPMSIDAAWVYQELLYRMDILQVCQMFATTAPVGNDLQTMFTHYQMVDIYFENLSNERRNGLVVSDTEQARRHTAHQSLCQVVADYRRRFGSFQPKDPEQYKKEIGKVISTFLPVWIQMRNTYVNIITKEIAA